MKQLVCEMCGSTSFVKENDVYKCQHCGCSYAPDMSEVVSCTTKDNEEIGVAELLEKMNKKWADIPVYNAEKDGRIYADVLRIGHAEKTFVGMQLTDVYADGFGMFGCGYEMELYNVSGEKIKYFSVLSTAYNPVDDKLDSNVTRFTGPVEKGEYCTYWVDGIWNKKSISSAKIDAIMVELFDGRKIVYHPADVQTAPDNLDMIRLTRTDKIPHCAPDTPNKIYLAITGVCHEELDMDASMKAMGQIINKRVPGAGSDKFGVEFEVAYLAGKTINTIKAFLQPLNAVSDKVGARTAATINGPLDAGDSGKVYFELWDRDNPEIAAAKLEGFIVNFADGTAEFYDESDAAERPAAPNRAAGGSEGGGCYVATAVYGSYDCPQVWTLRRYRDDTLAATWYGRAFIRSYYAISPTLVKWFGHTEWFKNMWQRKLDRMVAELQANGVESGPYEDQSW